MTITYNKKEAEKELSIKKMQEKTIVVQNKKKIKALEILICIDVILGFAFFILFVVTTSEYISDFDSLFGLATIVGIIVVIPAASIGSYLSDLQTKLLDKNQEIKTLSINAKYHKYHENKTLVHSDLGYIFLKLNFVDESGKSYCETINVERFERDVADNIKDIEVNLYEKKIYKPNPNSVSFHTGTPQKCSRQIHKNKRKVIKIHI